MTNSVSLNTSLLNGNGYPFMNSLNFTSNNLNAGQVSGTQNAGGTSLFSPIQSNNFYNDDFMMSGFDFNSLSYDPQTGSIFQQKPAQNQQAQVALPQQNNAGMQNFTSNPASNNTAQAASVQNANGQPNFSELENYLVKKENAQPQAPSNTCKIAGTTLGFLAPVVERVISGLKSGSVVKALNLKQLAVTCPIIALAGFGIGYLADGIINSIRGNKTTAQQNPKQQPATQPAAQNQQAIAQQPYQPLQIAA